MLDPLMRYWIDPPLNGIARGLASMPVSANQLTWIAFGLGMLAAAALAFGQSGLALALFLSNRLLDGLDGAVARQHGATDLGGYLDIVLDFVVYGLLALAFAWSDPAAALAAVFLLASFMGTASSFLAYAVVAAKRGLDTSARGEKSFYYLGGLAEGTETILFFSVCLLWPAAFSSLAWAFGVLCWITTAGRVLQGIRDFRD